MTTAYEQRSILIYCGKGSDEESRKMLFTSMSSVVDQNVHDVKYLTAHDLKEGSWVSNCQLLTFGGGYDLGYNESVGRDGMKQIQDFVSNGGNYLGLCAGGYWGCDAIEFDKNGPLEVRGERFLKFFPGICIGPAFPGFKYNSNEGMQAVPVQCEGTGVVDMYMNGGGYFLPYHEKHKMFHHDPLACSQRPKVHSVDNKVHTRVPHNRWKALGVYSSLGMKPAAIVKCHFGKGTAILSGVHLEYPVKLLKKEDPHLLRSIPTLQLSEEKRLFVFTDLLRQLGVIVRQCKAIL